MKGVFLFSAIFSIFALIAITVFLFASGLPFIMRVGFGNFLFGTKWAPLATSPLYGILSMIVATLFVTALSVIIGVGIGLFTAICLYKFCPKKLVAPIRQMVNLLAGIPSVIFGLFGLTLIVPFLRDYLSPNGVGYGILAASIVLAIMILPTIVSVSLDAMTSVPENFFEGALALGATKEQATFNVMLPSAKSGIFAGIVLAIGRAIGETMAVIMVIGGSPEMPNSLFQSVRTLTANIAMGATELSGDALSALIASGVVLFMFTLLLNISFSLLKSGKKEKKVKISPQSAVEDTNHTTESSTLIPTDSSTLSLSKITHTTDSCTRVYSNATHTTESSTSIPTDSSTSIPTESSTRVPTKQALKRGENRQKGFTKRSTLVPTESSTSVPSNTTHTTDSSTRVPSNTTHTTDSSTRVSPNQALKRGKNRQKGFTKPDKKEKTDAKIES